MDGRRQGSAGKNQRKIQKTGDSFAIDFRQRRWPAARLWAKGEREEGEEEGEGLTSSSGSREELRQSFSFPSKNLRILLKKNPSFSQNPVIKT